MSDAANMWPTAQAIDQTIAHFNASNNTTSPITGMGDVFIHNGQLYGINPGFAAALSASECQLGAATNDVLVPYNNFGGNTSGDGASPGTAGSVYLIDRSWQANATPQDGIAGIFKNLNSSIYRATGGNASAIITIYSPPSENDLASKWANMSSVGKMMGIQLSQDTNIYMNGGTALTPDPSVAGASGNTGSGSGSGFSILSGLGDAAGHVVIRGGIFLLGIVIVAGGLYGLRKQ